MLGNFQIHFPLTEICFFPPQDFRDAVAKATRQNGKPVVDERVLSQVLYYLPQLYQLNKDLLRELEERVAHWYVPTPPARNSPLLARPRTTVWLGAPRRNEHQRLADIFVQKGPYLKMYSTYIRQFDDNVALLDEQCRKNPAFAAALREFEVTRLPSPPPPGRAAPLPSAG